MRVKINYNDEDLYCVYSKERIQIGEKYAIVEEQIYDGEVIEKVYKLEYVPDESEDDEIYIYPGEPEEDDLDDSNPNRSKDNQSTVN